MQQQRRVSQRKGEGGRGGRGSAGGHWTALGKPLRVFVIDTAVPVLLYFEVCTRIYHVVLLLLYVCSFGRRTAVS